MFRTERDRAEKSGHHKEYSSKRLSGYLPWGSVAKWMTHRKERAAGRREAIKARKEFLKDDDSEL